jgi:hypothetical protein
MLKVKKDVWVNFSVRQTLSQAAKTKKGFSGGGKALGRNQNQGRCTFPFLAKSKIIIFVELLKLTYYVLIIVRKFSVSYKNTSFNEYFILNCLSATFQFSMHCLLKLKKTFMNLDW